MTDRKRGPIVHPERPGRPRTSQHVPQNGSPPQHRSAEGEPSTGRALIPNPAMRIPQPANDPRFPPSPIEMARVGGQAATAARPPRFKWLKRLAVFFGFLLGIGLVATAALHVRLSKGPIEIPMLVASLEEGLSQELGDTQVKIGAVILFRSERTNRIEFRLRNISLVDRSGTTVARAPTAAIDLSRNALMVGTIAPKRIELIRPRLLLSYDASGGLSLRFAGFQKAAAGDASGSTATDTKAVAVDPGALNQTEAVNIVEILKDAFRAARERKATTSSLKHVGIRDAAIIFRTPTRQTVWTAPNLGFALRHQSSRSTIRGDGTLSDGGTPWEFAFEIDDTPARGAFQVRTLFKDMIPGEFGRAVPVLADLEALETPLSGKAEFHLAQDGTLASASADIVVGAGYMRHSLAGEGSGVLLDEGHIKFNYAAETREVRVEKVDLLSADGRMVLAGLITPPPMAGPSNRWNFDLNGKLRFGSNAVTATAPLGDLALRGSVDPASGAFRFDSMGIGWPDGSIVGRAQVAADGSITLDGQIGEMPKSGVLQAWPSFVLSDIREWLVANVDADLITGGQFSASLPPNFRERIDKGADIPAEAVSLDLQTKNMSVIYADGLAPLVLPKAVISIRGRTFRVKAPKGYVSIPSGARLGFTQSDLVVRDLRRNSPEAQVFMKVSGDAKAVSEYLEQDALKIMKAGTLPRNVTGKASGVLRLRFPMSGDLERHQVKLNGKIKLENAAAENVFGDIDVAGGAINFDLTEKAVEANGDILVNGVPAQMRWLRLLEGPEDNQPPLRISAKLDAADRTQVGLNVNHIVDGTIAADVTIVPTADGPSRITVQADLSQSEVGLDYLSWRKPPGKAALVQFDVAENKNGLVELQNFKVVGDDIAIDGWILLGADNRVQKFALPEFSVDLITRMEIEGELRKDDVWDVRVRASSFDARPLFRNLFAPKRLAQHLPAKSVRRSGLVIRAFLKSMVGFSDASMKDVQVVLQRRDGKLIGLEANGALDSGAPIAARITSKPGQARILRAETRDAGQAFRLIGFYKNIRRGEAKLQVNLDDPGQADISGILWTRDFFMLGDPVVNSVLNDAGNRKDGSIQGIETRRDNQGKTRTVIQFDQMRVNFSVGNGQFLLTKSFINGPALGATIRGKVDFERRRVQLGGTYVPLYGLNSALGSLPILGQLFVSRRGEGVLGITFGVQGSLDNPEVLVNPVSLVAPGIFRKIFEINPSKQRITPRRKARKASGGGAPKASSAPAYKAPTGSAGTNWPSRSNN